MDLYQQPTGRLEMTGHQRYISHIFRDVGSSNMSLYVRPQQVKAVLPVEIAANILCEAMNKLCIAGWHGSHRPYYNRTGAVFRECIIMPSRAEEGLAN